MGPVSTGPSSGGSAGQGISDQAASAGTFAPGRRCALDSTLAAASEKFAHLARGSLDRPVPACPDWKVVDLVGHLGGVYSWVTLVLAAGGERPSGVRATPPADRDEIIDWFSQQRGGLLEAFASTPGDAPAWSFSSRGEPAASWWLRRQAVETAVHLHDLEEAVGYDADADPAGARTVSVEAAGDGVDEMLCDLVLSYLDRHAGVGVSGTLHVHCTDTPGEWLVDFDARPPRTVREHAKADAAVRGPAGELLLWLWNRRSLEGSCLEVFGDAQVARSWQLIRL
jgi:uncharacterized protein (TIGR03083 family)